LGGRRISVVVFGAEQSLDELLGYFVEFNMSELRRFLASLVMKGEELSTTAGA
jgi:hypothetical protein